MSRKKIRMMSSQNSSNSDSFVYSFSSFGIKISLAASSKSILLKMKKIVESLPLNHTEFVFRSFEHRFRIDKIQNQLEFSKNEEMIDISSNENHILKYLENSLKLTVAEFAVSKVFIHAGAVSYKNHGIIFPAKSFQGKSTLTTELLKAGCLYYSDDYAVLDEDAVLHPFPKKISLRGTDGELNQICYPVEHFDGKAATSPVKVKVVLFTQYEKNYKWEPVVISEGMGMLEIIPHTIPIRFNTKFSLKVLHKLLHRAIITKSKRGDAKSFVSTLLNFIDTNCLNSP